MQRWIARAAGGTSQRLKPGPATVRDRSSSPPGASAASPPILIVLIPTLPPDRLCTGAPAFFYEDESKRQKALRLQIAMQQFAARARNITHPTSPARGAVTQARHFRLHPLPSSTNAWLHLRCKLKSAGVFVNLLKCKTTGGRGSRSQASLRGAASAERQPRWPGNSTHHSRTPRLAAEARRHGQPTIRRYWPWTPRARRTLSARPFAGVPARCCRACARRPCCRHAAAG